MAKKYVLCGMAHRLTTVTNNLRVVQLPQLAAELTAVDSGYRSVHPCINSLLTRVAHIDATVIALPASVTVGGTSCCESMASNLF